jgi:hypothetical protein
MYQLRRLSTIRERVVRFDQIQLHIMIFGRFLSYRWNGVPHIYNTAHTANDCIPSASAPNASIRMTTTQKSYQLDLIILKYCAALWLLARV